ncbi:MAG: succinate dehydrogenase, cytochrome b556 subunit [Pseudomonadota bacterium]|nr:succinate dehydrogenase, cytochrome b556 subunit [Pseudomonadota bacterium]
MDPASKPLSPHLQVYRPQITSILSITHRITGVILAIGSLALVWWLNAAAYGPDSFYNAQAVLSHWVGRVFLFGWTVCLFFHLCNGIRHLFWDAGKGFEIEQVSRTGWLVIIATIGLTGLSWLAGYGLLGL